MSVNTELQALLTKMGGTPLESDSNSDLIKKISDAYEGGGTSGGVLIVTNTDGTLDKTWQEIHDAMLSHGAVFISEGGGVTSFNFAGTTPMGIYHVDTAEGDEFYTDSADGYPVSRGEQ